MSTSWYERTRETPHPDRAELEEKRAFELKLATYLARLARLQARRLKRGLTRRKGGL